jgi:hypothetical protein
VPELIADLSKDGVQNVLLPHVDEARAAPLHNQVVDVVACAFLYTSRPALLIRDNLDCTFEGLCGVKGRISTGCVTTINGFGHVDAYVLPFLAGD